jgi:hypothetical protein
MAMPAIDRMNRTGRGPFSTAMFGFVITAVFVSYQLLTDSQSAIHRESLHMLLFIVFCPPSLLSVAIDTEFGSNSFYLLWTVIALLNAGLYATVRLIVSRGLQRRN